MFNLLFKGPSLVQFEDASLENQLNLTGFGFDYKEAHVFNH